MIEAAEKRGDIKPGDTWSRHRRQHRHRPGAGGAAEGLQLVLVVPDKMSREKIFNLKAMGAQVVLTRSDVAKGHPDYYQDMAERIARETPAPTSSTSSATRTTRPRTNGTGPEILRHAFDGRLDAIVFGCGSWHHDRPVALLRQESPQTELILADPVGSILGTTSTAARSWKNPRAGWWKASARISCPDFRLHPGEEAYAISDKESFLTARELLEKRHPRRFFHRDPARRGAEVLPRTDRAEERAGVRLRHRQQVPVEDVQRLLDAGQRLPRTAGARRPARPDPAPYSQRDTVVVGPKDLLVTAYQRMKLYDVSQLPVVDGDALVGIVDESDVLLHVYGDEARFRDPVSTAMVSKLDRLDVKSPIEALLPVFDRGHVAIVMDAGRFLGLITRIDLLNYLRRRVQ